MHRTHANGLTATQRSDVAAIILYSVTRGLRNVRLIVADAILQVHERDDSRTPSSRQIHDFINYAKAAKS